jgi:hypothetical protein
MAQTELTKLSSKALKTRLADAERTLGQIEEADAAEVVRSGRAERVLQEMDQALETIAATKTELDARSPKTFLENAPLIGENRRRSERKSQHPASGPLNYVARTLDPPELQGCNLNPARLSDEEGEELKALVDKLGKSVRGEPDADSLTDTEQARYERLAGKAAGDERIFEHRRRKKEVQKKMAAIKEQQRVDALPKRPRWEEQGSVTLPRYVFEWLENSHDGWTVADIGMLVTLLGMFENRSTAIIRGSRFEEEDGDLVLVVLGGWDAFRFAPGRNGNPLTMDSGSVRERSALGTLARNGWFEGTVAGLELRIRLGPRARKARDGKQVEPTTA